MSVKAKRFYELLEYFGVDFNFPNLNNDEFWAKPIKDMVGIVTRAESATRGLQEHLYGMLKGGKKYNVELTQQRNDLFSQLAILNGNSAQREGVSVSKTLLDLLQVDDVDERDFLERHRAVQFKHDLMIALNLFQHEFRRAGVEYDPTLATFKKGYIDTIIAEQPAGLALKAVVMAVAEGVYVQHEEPKKILQFVQQTPWLDQEQKKAAYTRMVKLTRGEFKISLIQARMKEIVKTQDIENIQFKDEYLDKTARGYHLNYMMFDNIEFEAETIAVFKMDLDGNTLVGEELQIYLYDYKRNIAIVNEYGQLGLCGITEQVVNNQIKAGMVRNRVKSNVPEGIVKLPITNELSGLLPS